MILRAILCGLFLTAMSSLAIADSSKKSSRKKADAPVSREIPSPAYVTLALVRDDAVHDELELTSEQLANVKEAVSKVDEPLWVLRDTPLDRCGDQVDALQEQLRGDVQKAISADQWSRLEQIILQARGFKALRSPEIRDALGISDTQLAKLQKLLDNPSAPPTNDAAKANKKPSKPVDPRRVYEVLTEEQQSKLLAMFGRPFDLRQVTQIGCVAPDFRKVDDWINGDEITRDSFRGKVTVIHFWTFGCINCIHNLPHYESWREKFSEKDVAIIGFHTPETEAEHNLDNVRKAVREKGIKWTVAVDTDSENWKAWGNHTWPSVYLVDKQGRVRYWWYGEMNWQGAKGEEFMRKKIEELTKERS